MTTALLEDRTRDQFWAGPVIDCDVHACVPSLEALFPYQDPVWVEAARERGYRGPPGLSLIYPPLAPTTARSEWRPADGPGSRVRIGSTSGTYPRPLARRAGHRELLLQHRQFAAPGLGPSLWRAPSMIG